MFILFIHRDARQPVRMNPSVDAPLHCSRHHIVILVDHRDIALVSNYFLRCRYQTDPPPGTVVPARCRTGGPRRAGFDHTKTASDLLDCQCVEFAREQVDDGVRLLSVAGVARGQRRYERRYDHPHRPHQWRTRDGCAVFKHM